VSMSARSTRTHFRVTEERCVIDTEHDIVPGARDVADVLESDPLFGRIGFRLAHPVTLGIVVFALVLAMIVFGPSTESRFIYTDF
jgi:hypothetical protein